MCSPETCIDRLNALRDAMGIDHFNVSFYFGDLKHEQVMPAFQ